jgi:hypothetical protein
MTTRPPDPEWAVLDWDTDPVPGDPEALEDLIRAYRTFADTAQQAHDLLASGSKIEQGKGQTMEKFQSLIGQLPDRLDTMAQSYYQAVTCYQRYIPVLQDAQAMSLRALDHAQQAHQDQLTATLALTGAQTTLHNLQSNPHPDPTQQHQATDASTTAQHRLDDAQQALDQAKSLLTQAIAERDQAANQAAHTLRTLADHAPQRSIWEKIKEAFEHFFHIFITKVVQWLTVALDALAAVCSFIPGIGNLISMGLGLISTGLSAAAAAITGDKLDLGLALGSLALSFIPGGKLAGDVAKLATKAGKTATGSIKNGIQDSAKSITMDAGKPIAGKLTVPGGRSLADDHIGSDDFMVTGTKYTKGWFGSKKVPVTFHVHDVEFHPLKNSKDKVDCVLFPSKSTDKDDFANWFSKPNSADAVFYRAQKGKEPDTVNEPPEISPWALKGHDANFFVAHGSPGGAGIRLKDGTVLSVGEEGMAKILHHNEVWQNLTKSKPNGAPVALSCSFGKGDHGGTFADVLRGLAKKYNNPMWDKPVYVAENTVQAIPHRVGVETVSDIGIHDGGGFAERAPKPDA